MTPLRDSTVASHLWADTMVTSQATPNSSSTAAAPDMVGRSESLPMMMPTRAAGRTLCSWVGCLLVPAAVVALTQLAVCKAEADLKQRQLRLACDQQQWQPLAYSRLCINQPSSIAEKQQ